MWVVNLETFIKDSALLALMDNDKLAGMFLGGILGDALGVRIEFLNKQKIIEKYGSASNYLEAIQRKKEVISRYFSIFS